ncbi:MAG TPA: hypothetical protein VNU84_03165 [Candidatus Acidoferrum sp.]|jgi:hypothetical protein|nr:hypothetical protein [Candidatus Acidoferrum sp.]
MERNSQFGKRRGERGGSKLNMLLAILIVGGIAYVGWKLIPPYFANYQFQDAIETESRFALTGYPKRSQDDIQNEVFKKAQELGIRVKPDDVHVVMDATTCAISLDYSVPIDLQVYQFSLQFHDHADNHTI